MTYAQIEKVLADKGYGKEAWITFEDDFQFINLNPDRVVFINAKAVQFYFSNEISGNYMLMRYTKGKPVLYVDTLPANHVLVPHDGSSYILELESGGKVDGTAGKFHDIVNIDCITGFYWQ